MCCSVLQRIAVRCTCATAARHSRNKISPFKIMLQLWHNIYIHIYIQCVAACRKVCRRDSVAAVAQYIHIHIQQCCSVLQCVLVYCSALHLRNNSTPQPQQHLAFHIFQLTYHLLPPNFPPRNFVDSKNSTQSMDRLDHPPKCVTRTACVALPSVRCEDSFYCV